MGECYPHDVTVNPNYLLLISQWSVCIDLLGVCIFITLCCPSSTFIQMDKQKCNLYIIFICILCKFTSKVVTILGVD